PSQGYATGHAPLGERATLRALAGFFCRSPQPLFSKQVSTTLKNQEVLTDGRKLSNSNNRRRDAGKNTGTSVSGLPAVRLIASQCALCAKRLQLDGLRCLRAILH